MPEFLPLQPGDVPNTFADVSTLEKMTQYRLGTSVTDGVRRFIDWYRDYHGI